MQALRSNVDVRSEQFRKNRADILEQIEQVNGLLEQVAGGGGPEAMNRLRSRGRLPVRERVANALDRDSPFLEISPLAAWNSYYTVGSGFVLGVGVISGTECVILGHDPSVRAGAFNEFNSKKLMRGLEIARINRLPYVQFVESAGADLRGNTGDDPDAQTKRTLGHFAESGRLFYEISELSKMRIPTVSIVFGASTAGGAYQPGMSDYNIFVKNQAMVSLGGPPLVKMATGEDAEPESIGGADMHCRVSGLGDYLAQDEMDGIRLCRDVIAHLNWRKEGPGPSLPPDDPVLDPEELLGLVSRDLRSPLDIREVIGRIVDGSRFEEFKPLYGPTIVCGWSSIHGYPVGILGNNGALFSESAEKATQFIQLCNQIDVPLLFLHNITGYIVGTDYEQGGITKNGSKMINAVANSTVPHLSVIVGASYGAGQLRHERPRLRHPLHLHLAHGEDRGDGPGTDGRRDDDRHPEGGAAAWHRVRRGGRPEARRRRHPLGREAFAGALCDVPGFRRRDDRSARHPHRARAVALGLPQPGRRRGKGLCRLQDVAAAVMRAA